jgi:hypothetical protein
MIIPGREEKAFSTPLQALAAPEKRAFRRYPVTVPVIIRWKDTGPREASGILRDVNDRGIFFYAQADIPVGVQVDLTFTVPRELTAPETFRFVGTLVRTEDSAGPDKGFAIAVSKSELLDQPRVGEPEVPQTENDGDAWTSVEEEPAAPSSGRSRSRRRIGIVATALGVAVLGLAFAARAILAAQQAAHSRASAVQNIQVWIDPSSGLYHCPGTAWYGKGAGGKYVSQKQAQLDGFHPAYQRPCEVAPPRGDSPN